MSKDSSRGTGEEHAAADGRGDEHSGAQVVHPLLQARPGARRASRHDSHRGPAARAEVGAPAEVGARADAAAERSTPAATAKGTDAAAPAKSTHAAQISPRPRKHNRVAMAVFVVLGAITCLVLGYWQLSRWNSTTGTFQNLGYALEWPFFAAFLVFAYRRFVRLEDQRVAARDAGLSPVEAGLAAAPDSGRNASGIQTEIPANFLPPRRSDREAMHDEPLDQSLLDYNRYLEDLAGRDQATTHGKSSDDSAPPRKDV